MAVDIRFAGRQIAGGNFAEIFAVVGKAGEGEVKVVHRRHLLVRVTEAFDGVDKIFSHNRASGRPGVVNAVAQMEGVGFTVGANVPRLCQIAHQRGFVLQAFRRTGVGDQLTGDRPQDLPGVDRIAGQRIKSVQIRL